MKNVRTCLNWNACGRKALGVDDTRHVADLADPSNANRNTCVANFTSKRRSLSERLLRPLNHDLLD